MRAVGISIIIFLLLLPAVSTAQESPSSFELNPPPRVVEARPADLATLVFELTHFGETSEIYDFDVSLPAHIHLLAPLAPIEIESQTTEHIFVTLVLSKEILGGRVDLTLRATPRSRPANTQQTQGQLQVRSTATLEIIPPTAVAVEPGETAKLVFQLINRGNASDRYSFNVVSRQGLPLHVEEDVYELLPGEERDFTVLVHIPNGVSGGDEFIQVTGVSLSRNKETRSSVRFQVMPALPSRVGGSLFFSIPTTLALTFAGDPSSPLSISERISGRGVISTGGQIAYQLAFIDISQLETFQVSLENAQFRTTIGDLSSSLNPFFGIIGRGGSVMLMSPNAQDVSEAAIAFILPSSSQAVAGGRARTTIFNVTPHVGLRMTPALEEVLGGISISAPVAELGNFTLSTAFSRDGATPFDKVFQVSQRALIGNLAVNAAILHAGRDFLGSPSDVLSLSLDQILSVTGLAVQGRYSFARNNVIHDPAVTTVFNTNANTSVRIALTSTTDVSSQFRYTSARNPEPALVDDRRDFGVNMRLTQRFGLLAISAIHERVRSRDLIGGTDIERVAWRSITDVPMGLFSTQIRLGLISERDVLTDLLISNFMETTITARLTLSIASLALSIERVPGATNLNARITSSLGNLSLASSKTLQVSDSGDISFSFSLNTILRFDLPIPLMRDRGRLEGFIYFDENQNGQRDSGEAGVTNVVLDVDGRLLRTDSTGFFRSQPLARGEASLSLNNLPSGYVPMAQSPLIFPLRTGQIVRVEIPVAQVGFVRGSAFDDLNQNGIVDPGERGIGSALIRLSGPTEVEVRTTPSGQFSFEVPPGSYQLAIEPGTLPNRYESTSEISQLIEVELGKITAIHFGAVEVIEIRFAPLAEFSFSPEEIRPGDVVTFNGTLSQDTDGEIVSYQWDFDGDDVVDATGAIVSTTFDVAGEISVKLTVVDNSGQQDSATKNINISD